MLKDILYKVNIREVYGDTAIVIESLETDSRKVTPGTCFLALKGTLSDGHDFIDAAIEKGAVAIVCERIPETLQPGVTYIAVADSAVAAGIISHNFFGEPSSRLKIVGVTGTNGKTTIATLLWKLFTGLGYKCGLISTVQNQIGEQVLPSTHTTPDAIRLNELLKKMADQGCEYAFMECSSHAIHQNRIAGIDFSAAVFSNITHDHLD